MQRHGTAPATIWITITVAALGVGALIAYGPRQLIDYLCSNEFLPHGHCYQWLPEILWLHVGSDGLIALSYFIIPVGLFSFVTKRQGLRFGGVFWLFGAFILLCGLTHLLEIYNVWNGAYRLTGAVKLVTGLVSIATATYLILHLPRALRIPLPAELQETQANLARADQGRESAERRLAERERLFEAIVKSGLDAFILLETARPQTGPTDFRILQLNDRAAAELGRPTSELISQSFADVFPRCRELKLTERMEWAEREGLPLAEEIDCGEGSQGRRWIHCKIVPAADRIALLFRDISERKRAELEAKRTMEREASQALLKSQSSAAMAEAAIAAAVHGILIVNNRGRIVQTNAQLRSFFGYTEEELNGQSVEMLVPDAARGDHRQQRHGYHHAPQKRQMGSEMHLYGRRKDGSLFPVEVGLNPFSTHDGEFVMASVLDITERLAAQRALQTKNEEIEQMVYAVSHDLKAPLASIQGLSTLLKDINAVEDESTRDILDRIDKSAIQMGHLISDVLEMSRVGRSDETVEAVQLDSVIADVREMLTLESKEKNCQWEVIGPFPAIQASRKRIFQVLQNLAANALKYGCVHSTNRIEVGCAIKHTYLELYVQDFGPGIDPQSAKEVFEPFKRLDSQQEGTGIGLAIVAKIMKQLGGDARLESDLGRGARFILEFPRNLIVSDTAEHTPEPTAAHAPPVYSAPRPARPNGPPSKQLADLSREYLKQFVYAAAHDFNAPIATINGHLAYLRDEIGSQLTSEAQRLLDYSIEASSRMSEYTRLLVQFSAALDGRGLKQPVAMADALKAALATPSFAAAEAEVNVDWDSLPTVVGDREMLELLLIHLLDNSRKFAQPGAKPQINIYAIKDEWNFILSIADHGIGIDESLRQEVFAPFKKHQNQTDFSGCGIGLAICQKIVEAHHGTIWIESNAPHGTIIRISLSQELAYPQR